MPASCDPPAFPDGFLRGGSSKPKRYRNPLASTAHSQCYATSLDLDLAIAGTRTAEHSRVTTNQFNGHFDASGLSRSRRMRLPANGHFRCSSSKLLMPRLPVATLQE